MPWAWHTGPQPHACPATDPCHAGRCTPLQLQSPAAIPGIAAPPMTIVSWARTSWIERIDGTAAEAIAAAMIKRVLDTWFSLLLDVVRGSAIHLAVHRRSCRRLFTTMPSVPPGSVRKTLPLSVPAPEPVRYGLPKRPWSAPTPPSSNSHRAHHPTHRRHRFTRV